MFRVRNAWELWCIGLIAVYGSVIGGIIGTVTWLTLPLVLLPMSAFFNPSIVIDTSYYKLFIPVGGIVFVVGWGIGLGGLLGGCKALVSRGDNWVEWFKSDGGTFLWIFPT